MIENCKNNFKFNFKTFVNNSKNKQIYKDKGFLEHDVWFFKSTQITC